MESSWSELERDVRCPLAGEGCCSTGPLSLEGHHFNPLRKFLRKFLSGAVSAVAGVRSGFQLGVSDGSTNRTLRRGAAPQLMTQALAEVLLSLYSVLPKAARTTLPDVNREVVAGSVLRQGLGSIHVESLDDFARVDLRCCSGSWLAAAAVLGGLRRTFS